MIKKTREIFAGLADTGVMLPLLVALSITGQINTVLSFVFIGVFYIIWSFHYKSIIAVQPLKSFCAAAIAMKIAPETLRIEAAIIATIFLITAYPPFMNWIKKYCSMPIVRGIQISTGCLLIRNGVNYPSLEMIGWTVLVAVIILLVSMLTKFPVLLLVVVGGAIVGMNYACGMPTKSIVFAKTGIFEAFMLLVLPQIGLSVGNAMIATEDTAKVYFADKAHRLRASSLSLSMAIMNYAAAIFGTLPLCHGCGGMTAHYRTGGRDKVTTIAAGVFYIFLGILVWLFGIKLIQAFPLLLLNALLVFVGLEHILLGKDLRGRAILIAGIVVVGYFLTNNIGYAFIIGIFIELIIKQVTIN